MTSAPALGRPPSLLHRANLPFAVGAVALVTLGAFENRAVTTVLPTVAVDLGGLWLFGAASAAPLISFVVATTVAGRWADRRGPVQVLYGGMGLFVGAELLMGVAPAMPVFVGRPAPRRVRRGAARRRPHRAGRPGPGTGAPSPHLRQLRGRLGAALPARPVRCRLRRGAGPLAGGLPARAGPAGARVGVPATGDVIDAGDVAGADDRRSSRRPTPLPVRAVLVVGPRRRGARRPDGRGLAPRRARAGRRRRSGPGAGLDGSARARAAGGPAAGDAQCSTRHTGPHGAAGAPGCGVRHGGRPSAPHAHPGSPVRSRRCRREPHDHRPLLGGRVQPAEPHRGAAADVGRGTAARWVRADQRRIARTGAARGRPRARVDRPRPVGGGGHGHRHLLADHLHPGARAVEPRRTRGATPPPRCSRPRSRRPWRSRPRVRPSPGRRRTSRARLFAAVMGAAAALGALAALLAPRAQ